MIEKLKRYDGKDFEEEAEEELARICEEIALQGESAVPMLIEVLNDRGFPSSLYAAETLGQIGDRRAIGPLVNALEDGDIGGGAQDALKCFGPACIPAVIKKVEYRIKHPVKEKGAFHTKTMYPLSTIGEIRCLESVDFLNRLLDDYVAEMPREVFDPTKYKWKYRNVDFFHLLDCMVRQQDENAIPHIRKARDAFPGENVEYSICEIAIERIMKGEVEGYLPMEALEMAVPTEAIMDLFMHTIFGREQEGENPFDHFSGDYSEDEQDEQP